MSDEPRPGTTASLDQRVGRLEIAQAAMTLTLQRLELSQEHQGKLFEVRFGSIDTSLSANTAMISTFITKVEAAMAQGVQMAGDPEATPAGRTIIKQLGELEVGRKENRAAIEAIRSQIAKWSGALAVLVVLAQVVIPILLKTYRLGD